MQIQAHVFSSSYTTCMYPPPHTCADTDATDRSTDSHVKMQCIHPKHLQALAELVVPNNVPKPLNPQHPKHLQVLAELMVPNNVSRGEGLESIPQNHKHRCAERKNSTVDGEKKSFFFEIFCFYMHTPESQTPLCREKARWRGDGGAGAETE